MTVRRKFRITITVSSCAECPHCQYSDYMQETEPPKCLTKNKSIKDIDWTEEIPDWCPELPSP